MIQFSNCKINIGLYVVEKRTDGFHNLETVFLPLPLFDVIEIIPSHTTTLHIYNQSIPGNLDDNIILKAYKLLAIKYNLPPLQFHLLKNIPIGAGLGAGSANGAYTLQLLNNYFSLNIPKAELLKLALSLGSDCPFFIENTTCLASKRGEILTPLQLNFNHYKLLIINPGIHIATPWAFSHIIPATPKHDLQQSILNPLHNWKNTVFNDFEPAVFQQYPQLKTIKDLLYKNGAIYASMTGTGSTMYGIFEKSDKVTLHFPNNYWVKEVNLG